jgi:hypothetical protein
VVFTDYSGSFVCSTPNGVEMSENVPWGLRKVLAMQDYEVRWLATG